MISIQHLSVQLQGRDILKDISFAIPKGRIVMLLGENGSGKTTLIRSLLQYIPYKGCILHEKSDIHSLKQRQLAALFSYVPQIKETVEDLAVEECIVSGFARTLSPFALPSKKQYEQVHALLKDWNLSHIEGKLLQEISGGELQMTYVARAFLQDAALMVMDEPCTYLDYRRQHQFLQEMLRLKLQGRSMLISMHDPNLALQYADELVLLHQGKQIAFDTPEQIFSRADLQSYGVNPPAYTRICQAFGVKKENGCYPASLKDALALKDLFPGEEAFCPEKILLDNNKDMKNKNGQIEDSVTTDESMKLTISCKKNVFDIEHLEFQYLENVPVLQDINLTIDHRPTAIIGQNGAGKTTLVKLLKGLLKPVGGSIYYGGSDMAEKTVAMLAGEIGYVFQNPDDQIFKYHVIDEVMFGPQNIGMTKEQAKEKAVAALKLVGLEQLADENPYDLELSERKLVAIASVLAMDTKVLILDEPTIAQDWKGRKIIQKMIRDLSSQGKTVIAILHDMDFVVESFERVIVMAHGKVLADGTKEEVFAQKDVLEQARIDQPYLTKLCQQLGYKNLYFSLKD